MSQLPLEYQFFSARLTMTVAIVINVWKTIDEMSTYRLEIFLKLFLSPSDLWQTSQKTFQRQAQLPISSPNPKSVATPSAVLLDTSGWMDGRNKKHKRCAQAANDHFELHHFSDRKSTMETIRSLDWFQRVVKIVVPKTQLNWCKPSLDGASSRGSDVSTIDNMTSRHAGHLGSWRATASAPLQKLSKEQGETNGKKSRGHPPPPPLSHVSFSSSGTFPQNKQPI